MRTLYRKKAYCQNCQYPLLDTYNFCPHCGQDNSDKLVPFSTLVTEFFGNLIGYDSKFSRTIKPFLFKPGELTNEFIQGRRASYMHPLRLYFIISFFYFFALTLAYKQDTNLVSFGAGKPAAGASEQEINNTIDGLNVTLDPDSLNRQNGGEATIFGKSLSVDFLKDKRTTDAQVVDSLGWKQNAVNRYLVRQGIKFARSDSKSIGTYFSEYMLSKASILMFFMLPIFALLLKLIYLRRKRYYVEHITFSLHIHAFAFLILLLMLIAERLWVNEWIGNLAAVTIIVYGVVAARKVYRQSWIKTIVKGFLLFIPYTLCFSLLAIIGIIIGGLVY
jgi:RNA polymerase subunit RPABC4/transcription elongation factor Spt4